MEALNETRKYYRTMCYRQFSGKYMLHPVEAVFYQSSKAMSLAAVIL